MMIKQAFALATLAALVSAARANVVISEAMPDPWGTDAQREWIEIYNNGSEAVNLTGWKIGDATAASTSAGEGMYLFPSNFTIAAGQVVTIGLTAEGFKTLNGFYPTLEFAQEAGYTSDSVPDMTVYDTTYAPGKVGLSNTADDLALVDNNNNLIDYISWSSTTPYASFYRVDPNANPIIDSTSGLPNSTSLFTWSAPYVNGSGIPGGTPGTVAVPEPVSAGIMGVGALALLMKRRRAD